MCSFSAALRPTPGHTFLHILPDTAESFTEEKSFGTRSQFDPLPWLSILGAEPPLHQMPLRHCLFLRT